MRSIADIRPGVYCEVRACRSTRSAQTLILLAVIVNLWYWPRSSFRSARPARTTPARVAGAIRVSGKTAELAAVLGETGDVASPTPAASRRSLRPGRPDRSWCSSLRRRRRCRHGLWREPSRRFRAACGAGLFVLVVHDLLPPGRSGPPVHLEGSVAVTFATLLVVLTGREASPFFFTPAARSVAPPSSSPRG